LAVGGAVPAGWLASAVRGVQAGGVPVVVVVTSWQVLRTKTFSTPFWTFEAKFVALVAKAINTPTEQTVVVVVVVPHSLMLGFSLSAFAGVLGIAEVSGEETKIVEGVQPVTMVNTSAHVSRT
jgi:hypothetical protein